MYFTTEKTTETGKKFQAIADKASETFKSQKNQQMNQGLLNGVEDIGQPLEDFLL